MLSLNDLRSPAVALDWHEAVAVAAALAGLVADAPRTIGCPDPAFVSLLPSGELRVAGPDVVGASPAQGLALVLGQLLESAPCPAELRQLVETYEDEAFAARAGDGAVVRFAASLAFFERPGRAEVLAAVAGRAEPALERARRDAAIDALTERTRLAATASRHAKAAAPVSLRVSEPDPQPAAGPAGREWPSDEGQGPGRFLIPAIGVAVFLAMAYVAASYFGAPPPAPAHASIEPAEADLPVSGPGLDQPAATPVPAPAPAAMPARPAAGPAPTVPGARPGAPAAPPPHPVPAQPTPSPSPAPPAAPPRTGVDVVVAERDGRVLPPATPPARPAPRVAAGRIFSVADPQVTPAVLIRPHLPEQPPPDVPQEQIGTLEFVVAESGAVEHVHLISPANRYQERMLVAAAKTWQFQPATRDGRPVRFRTRIRVTL